MHKSDGKCFWQHIQVIHGSHHAFFMRGKCQFVHKNQIFGYPLNMANGMLHCMVRHPLLMKSSRTLSTSIRKIGGSFDSFQKPRMGATVLFFNNVNSQIAFKIQNFGTLLLWQIRCCPMGRDIHCLSMFQYLNLMHKNQMGGASHWTRLPVMGATLSYLTNAGSQTTYKMRGFGILSVSKMHCCTEIWDIHCL